MPPTSMKPPSNLDPEPCAQETELRAQKRRRKTMATMAVEQTGEIQPNLFKCIEVDTDLFRSLGWR